MHVCKKIPAVEKSIIAGFSKQSSATVHEAMGQRGAIDPSIKPLAKGMKSCGRALTVRCHPGDNLMLIKAINLAKKGDVIVLDCGGFPNAGPFGEVLAVECLYKEVSGLVTNGSVRDSEAIIKLGFPVFSAGLCIRGTSKATLGTINHPICCGCVNIEPGDIILGDDDGVMSIPLGIASEVLIASQARVTKEDEVMAKLKSGASLFDLYGYQAVFERLGCIEEK